MPVAPPPIQTPFSIPDRRGRQWITLPWLKWLSGSQGSIGDAVIGTEDVAGLALFGAEGDRGAEIGEARQEAEQALLGDPVQRDRGQEIEDVRRLTPPDRPVGRPEDEDARRLAAFAGGTPQGLPDEDSRRLIALAVERKPGGNWVFLSDTHANRANHPAGAYPAGSFYWETDRTVLYMVVLTGATPAWTYAAGRMSGTLSPDQRPSDLGTDDAGFLLWATDYLHLYRWSGAVWAFGPGDPGSAFVVIGNSNGSAPNGGLWAACDGTAANVAQSNGTIASVTTQNLTGEVFIKGAAATAAQQAAVRATWEATAKTATKSGGTPAGTIDAPVFTGDAAGGVEVQAGAGETVVDHPYTPSGSVSAPNFTGSALAAHDHDLTDALSQLKVPSEANGGLPLRISCVFYMRR